MDPFSFREIGDPAAVGSKFGSVAGHETRVIYPEQKLTRSEFKPGRVLSWKWNSDGMAAWKPRDSRLYVEYKIAVGEVTETACAPAKGAQDGSAVTVAQRPAPSLRKPAARASFTNPASVAASMVPQRVYPWPANGRPN